MRFYGGAGMTREHVGQLNPLERFDLDSELGPVGRGAGWLCCCSRQARAAVNGSIARVRPRQPCLAAGEVTT